MLTSAECTNKLIDCEGFENESHPCAATHFEVGANNWSPPRLMNDFRTTLELSNDG